MVISWEKQEGKKEELYNWKLVEKSKRKKGWIGTMGHEEQGEKDSLDVLNSKY